MLRNVRWPLSIIAAHSLVVYFLKKTGIFEGVSLSEAFTSVGTSATAIVMIQSFRFRISYERWREADVLWRTVKTESIALFILISYHLGIHKDPLRVQKILEKVKETLISFGKNLHNVTLTHDRLLIATENKRVAILSDDVLSQFVPLDLSLILGECFKDKSLPIEQARYFNLHVNNLLTCVENLLRIRSTRTPRYYRNFSLFLIYFLSLVAPYLLVGSLYAVMIPLVLINAAIFLMMEQMSNRGEIPFGERKSDVPSLQIVKEMENQLDQYLRMFSSDQKRKVA